MPSRPPAEIVPLRPLRSADLSEALDAVELLGEVLTQSIGRRGPTRLQRTALGVVEGLKSKHNRSDHGRSDDERGHADRRRRTG